MNRKTLLLAVMVVVVAGASRADDRETRRTPIVKAVEKIHKSVVNISTERVVVRRSHDSFFGPGSDMFDRLFEEYFEPRGRVIERKKIQQPLGSGCIITADGLVVTNEHVVRRATNIKLSLSTGETLDAELLAADPEHDLALLRVKSANPLPTIPMGRSSDLMLGETVIALGNPFGFENSVTTGIVSAVRRDITVGSGRSSVHYKGLVQTSALINPGNSGGPLVNILGELVGINTAVVDHAQGIGFAIPIGRARDELAPLLAVRRVSRTWSGLTAKTIEKRGGVRITRLHPEGPAQDLLQQDDVIHKIDDQPVNDLFDFHLAIIQHSPDDAIKLEILRGEEAQSVELKLAQMPEVPLDKVFSTRCGLEGQNMTDALARHLQIRVRRGILLTAVDQNGPAATSGLARGDVIVQIGAHPVRNLQDAGEAVMDVLPGRQVLIGIVRGRYKAYTQITLGSVPPI